MLELSEFDEWLLWHEVTPAGPLPSALDPDGVYPYASFAETSRRPVLRRFRFVTLENEFLRVSICPELGGRVHSLVEKRSGHEILFVPASIHPVRILPRMGFVPGGIEVSFPISHSPVQLERVDFLCRRREDRLYVYCGERELRFGMQWTVEFSLGARDDFLSQRTAFRNPGRQPHPWMSWSNAAIPARTDTEFHFPGGPVLRHDAGLATIDWFSEGPRRVSDLRRMTGFFWLRPDVCSFGAFTPSLGHGLYHVADPTVAPGIKLWSYGVGRDEIWGSAASSTGESYLEIQGGPLRDQSIKQILQPGQTHYHVEFWRPTPVPLDIQRLGIPHAALAPLGDFPWFDWPPRPDARFWQAVLRAFTKQCITDLPLPPGPDQQLWAPSGMDYLGDVLAWAAANAKSEDRRGWFLQLGAWLAARDEFDAALDALSRSGDDRARALAGRLYRSAKSDPHAASQMFDAIQSPAIALHPQVVVERDLALAGLGVAALGQRENWLARVANSEDEWIRERQAVLLLDQGRPAEARALLERTHFQLVHQRYARTELWKRIAQASSAPGSEVPGTLGEDDLADFGAYREFKE